MRSPHTAIRRIQNMLAHEHVRTRLALCAAGIMVIFAAYVGAIDHHGEPALFVIPAAGGECCTWPCDACWVDVYIYSFQASPSTVPLNSGTNLNWTAGNNADRCELQDGNLGVTGTCYPDYDVDGDGAPDPNTGWCNTTPNKVVIHNTSPWSYNTPPFTSPGSYTFALICYNHGGDTYGNSSTHYATVNVDSCPTAIERPWQSSGMLHYSNATRRIAAHGTNTCATNNSGSNYFVPANTSGELQSFINAVGRLGVSLFQ